MEFIAAWFWIVKTILFLLTIGIAYKALISCRFQSTFWNILLALALLFAVISPVKIDGTNSTQYKASQENVIQQNKVVPEKTTADNWKKINVNGITKEDLK